MKQLYILSDGKPGHLNQSLGIAAYLEGYIVEIIEIKNRKVAWSWFKKQYYLKQELTAQFSDTLIIGAGSKTHIWLVLAKYWLGYTTVVLMKPNFPMFFFDICFIPEHDFYSRDISRLASHIYLTKGAPNKVNNNHVKCKGTLLFLIGGPSKSYDFFSEAILEMITCLAKKYHDKSIMLTTSRRTPPDFIQYVKQLNLEIEIIDGNQTQSQWLPEQLAKTEQVWVTEDSVSMVYEALSSGAKVGLLSLQKSKKAGRSTRIAHGLETLIKEKYLMTYTDYINKKALIKAPQLLKEAQRCADIITQRV